ncbi:MAG TPA: trypsin-like serine protease [Caulobacterales bacterium]|nr:trypsin-like serine protease [Caulobacterales bacterium]
MRLRLAALLALSALIATPAGAVVILEDTWRAHGGSPGHWDQGFEANVALAAQPQFRAMVSLSQDEGKEYGVASGVWIGNQDGHAMVLTAAHVFDDGSTPKGTLVRSAGGTVLRGVRVWIHPRWNSSVDTRGGFDFAIVELNGPINDVGDPPTLYAGRGELHHRCVIVGYGTHGVAPYGWGWRFGAVHGDRATAAENIVDKVTDIDFSKRDEDWGNVLSIDLDQPHGPGKNRWGDSEPVSPLEGILAPGDSGGSMWMQFNTGWRLVGVNSSGDPGADYQDVSNFARIATQQEWIQWIYPGAHFAE